MKYSLAITCLLAPSSQALKLRNFALMAESTTSNASGMPKVGPSAPTAAPIERNTRSRNDATKMKNGLCAEYKWLSGAVTLE